MTHTSPSDPDVLPALDWTRPPWPGTHEEFGGVRLHVRRTDPASTPDGAPTAVYVHGLGGSSSNWTDLSAMLAPRAHGIAVDLPGFGFSEPPPGFDYTLSAHTDAMCRFIEGLPAGAVHLFGNSMGGAIAAMIAARRPDLVSTLTLISPAVPDRRPDPRRLSDPRMVLAALPIVGKPVRRRLSAMSPAQRAQQMIDLCFADPTVWPPHRIEELADEHAARIGQAWATRALSQSTAGILVDWFRFRAESGWSTLRRITAPTLVVWGTHDRVISSALARRTAREIAGSELLLLSHTGHVAQMERPDLVAQAVVRLWRSAESGRC